MRKARLILGLSAIAIAFPLIAGAAGNESIADFFKHFDRQSIEDARRIVRDNVTAQHVKIALIIIGAIALLLTFLGLRLWRLFLAWAGILIGLIAGGALGFFVAQKMGKDSNMTAIITLASAGGGLIVMPLLMAFIMPLGTFIFAGIGAAGVAYAVATYLNLDPTIAVIVTAGCGVGFGLLIAVLRRAGAIIFSALIGAPVLTICALALAHAQGLSPEAIRDSAIDCAMLPFTTTLWAIMGCVALVGMAFQLLTMPRKKPKEPPATVEAAAPNLDEQLAKLTTLRQRNIITEEDYQRKRTQLLASSEHAAQSQMRAKGEKP